MKRKHKIINITVASFWRLKMMALNLNWRFLCFLFIYYRILHTYIFSIFIKLHLPFFQLMGYYVQQTWFTFIKMNMFFFLLINEIGVISIETAVKLIGYYIIIAGFMLISITKQSNKLNEYICLIIFIN